MNFGLLILRLLIGGLLVGHGTQKLFGWFGGHGLAGTGGFFEMLGFRPGRRYAALAGATEATAGVLLFLGLFTPLAAAMIIGTMLNAAVTVHGDKGLWVSDGGYEFPLVLAVVAAMFAFAGPGTASLDNALGWSLHGVLLGMLAVAVGLVAGGVILSIRQLDEVEGEGTIESADELEEAPS
jgi:putative oxidoreductase